VTIGAVYHSAPIEILHQSPPLLPRTDPCAREEKLQFDDTKNKKPRIVADRGFVKHWKATDAFHIR